MAIREEGLACTRGLVRSLQATYYDGSGADVAFEFAARADWLAPAKESSDAGVLAHYCPVLPRLHR